MSARSTRLATEPQQDDRAGRASRATGSSRKKTAPAKAAPAAKNAKRTPKTSEQQPLERPVEPLEETAIAGVRRDLAALALRGDIGKALATSAEAMVALALAKSIDNTGTSPTARAFSARALTETMQKLRELAPDESEEGDGIDDLAQRRERRRAGSAAA